MFSDLDQGARDILAGNDQGGYTVPSIGLYPYQWNWDSAFVALGFSTYDNDRAWREIETLFSGQWADGMVPHILYHEHMDGYFPGPDIWGGIGPVPSSGISQPPVAISFARRIFEKDPAQGRGRLAELYPSMLAWHRWFMRWRLDEGAVCATHPWEAGRDNAPDWDLAMSRIPKDVGTYTRCDIQHVSPEMRPHDDDYDRYIWLVQLGKRLNWDQAQLLLANPFRVADPTMTFVCLRAARDLFEVGQELHFDVEHLKDDISQLEDGVASLWNDSIGCYDSRTVPGGFTGVQSSASFLSWYAGVDDHRQLRKLRRALEQVRYPVASIDADSAEFDPLRYWRGPTWGFMNFMIASGLAEFGLEDEAESLRDSTRSLIRQSGFFEYYSPVDGQAAGGGSFAWTAAVWLAWAGPYAEDLR